MRRQYAPKGSRILLIDDSPTLMAGVEKLLVDQGFEVLCESTGAGGFERARSAQPDLVLLDVELPDVHGTEVARSLKSMGATARIPIIFLSAARVGSGDQREGLDAGADGYLARPFAPEVLFAMIRSALRARLTSERLFAAHRFSAALAAAASIPSLLATVVDLLPAATGARAAAMLLVAPDAAVAASPSWPEALGDARALDHSALGVVAWSGAAEWYASGAEIAKQYPDLAAAAGDGAFVGLPLAGGDGTSFGAIALVFSSTGAFGEIERAFLADIANRCAARLESLRSVRALHDAARAREDLLAIVAHDLRNPLNVLLLAGRLLERGFTDPVAIAKISARIIRSGERMNLLIGDLLDAGQFQAGTFALVSADDDALAMVDRAIEALAPLAEAKHIKLSRDVPAGLGVRCDARRIEQVLTNLIANAIKFTSAEGAITVNAVRRGDRVVLSVTDMGVGIAPEIASHVFDRYWKSGSGSGTGLGLYIARGIARAHGGDLEVRSELGTGSTFFFDLPAASAAVAAKTAAR